MTREDFNWDLAVATNISWWAFITDPTPFLFARSRPNTTPTAYKPTKPCMHDWMKLTPHPTSTSWIMRPAQPFNRPLQKTDVNYSWYPRTCTAATRPNVQSELSRTISWPFWQELRLHFRKTVGTSCYHKPNSRSTSSGLRQETNTLPPGMRSLVNLTSTQHPWCQQDVPSTSTTKPPSDAHGIFVPRRVSTLDPLSNTTGATECSQKSPTRS
jgi:hypothetical protein